MSLITIYTDGAYSPARDQGGVGVIFVKDGKELKAYNKMFQHVTNNQMELAAVIIALRAVLKNKITDDVNIITDSQYVIGCATKGWQRKKNIKLWDRFDKIIYTLKSKQVSVNFEWTKGHADNEFNIKADKLAVDASQELLMTF